MSNLTLVFCFEFERFPSVECDWNIKISRNVQILGFWKKMVFFLKTYMITVNVKAFVIKWIARKQLSELFKGAFIELSNLRRKFAMSTNIDSWFTSCVLSQQNSVSVEFVLWTLWFRKFSVWESKFAATPPFLYYCRVYVTCACPTKVFSFFLADPLPVLQVLDVFGISFLDLTQNQWKDGDIVIFRSQDTRSKLVPRLKWGP